MSSPISDLIEDLQSKLQALADVKNVVQVYSDDELKVLVQGVNGLTIGVLYQGTRSLDHDRAQTMRHGLACETRVALLVIHPSIVLTQRVPKSYGLAKLDAIRGAVRATVAPSGHMWRFVGEAQAQEKEGAVVWVQMWAVPIMLTNEPT